MQKNPGFFNLRALLVCALVSISALLGVVSFATITPPGGTLTDTSGPITFTGGPYLVANPSAQANGTPICNAQLPCDEYALTVSGLSGATTASKYIRIEVRWPNPQAEAQFDMYVFAGSSSTGNIIAQNLGDQTYVDPDAVLIPAINGTYTVRVVPFNPEGQSITGTVSLVPFPPVAPVGSGTPPSYSNHDSPPSLANDAGEPSIGVDWIPRAPEFQHGKVNTGGVAFFSANGDSFPGAALEARVSFDDSTVPPTATWEDVSAVNVQETAFVDPIGFVDHQTGRVFQLELVGLQGNSTAAYSDDDGKSWIPIDGGGFPAGPDHETLGGGPYNNAAVPPPPPHPLYANAVYYCSQNIVGGAECSRSDNGGVTFGPGVDIFNPVQCYGGIHGHVKVSPDGTVYVPNSSCSAGTGSQGTAISMDNGLTWVDHTIPGSVGTGDPSIGIGSDNTIYLGYINGDGRPHIAVSTDHGTNWTNDYEVGLPVGCAPGDQYAVCRLKSAVFPVVVAGDGDRAAFGFLGSTTGGNYQDQATYQGLWDFYVATTYDRGAHWVTVNATSPPSGTADPVQRGSICLGGLLCGSDRNLLDFNDMTVDKEGRVLASYADGCVIAAQGGNCTPPNYSGRSSKGAIIRQLSGRRLFAAYDVVPSSVVSRKTHTGVGDFDVNLPLTGTRGVECRSGGATSDYKLVFTFPNNLTSVGSASVTSGTGSVSSSAMGPNPHQYTVNLTGVTNAQYVTVTLINVLDAADHAGDVSATMGVLLGDTSADGVVNSADITQTRRQSGNVANSSNFREDVTLDGVVNSADITLVRRQSGSALPSAP